MFLFLRRKRQDGECSLSSGRQLCSIRSVPLFADKITACEKRILGFVAARYGLLRKRLYRQKQECVAGYACPFGRACRTRKERFGKPCCTSLCNVLPQACGMRLHRPAASAGLRFAQIADQNRYPPGDKDAMSGTIACLVQFLHQRRIA